MTTSPESLALLGRTAELRASGDPWPDAATQLAVGHDELRKLASEHSRDYDRLMRRARNDVLRETLDAALVALGALVKSPEPGLRMKAATTIVRYDLARMRYEYKDAGARLERDTRRDGRRDRTTDNAQEARNQNVPESPEVPNQQDVNAAKNVAQSTAPESASPPTPKPAPATPPLATPVARNEQAPLDDAARRRQRLVDDFALGRVPQAPLARGDRQTLEVDRLISGWLTPGD